MLPTAERDELLGSCSSEATQYVGVVEQATPTMANQTAAPKEKRNGCVQLLFGQFIALVAASQNAASFTLETRSGVIAPLFLLCNCYLVLALHLLRQPKLEEQIRSTEDDNTQTVNNFLPFTHLKLRVPLWHYMIISVLDVVPNYMVLLAFKYTSLTSATLLGSLTIPSTMVMCRIILGKRFTLWHSMGAVMCLVGGTYNIWSDFNNDTVNTTEEDSIAAQHAFWGDMLAVSAAMIYGLADALSEYFVKHVDRNEYLGMLGLCGCVISVILFPILEGNAVVALFTCTDSCSTIAGLIVWYIISLVLYYTSSTLFLIQSDATLMNLSLQGSNLWAAIFSIALLGRHPELYFYVAIAFVSGGVFLYEWGDSKEAGRDDSIVGDRNTTIEEEASTSSRMV